MNKKIMLGPYILKLQLSKILSYLSWKKNKQKKKNKKCKKNILDILGISVFGYSIYMYEKQELFSNDIDKFYAWLIVFKHEPVLCIQIILIV